jgi:phosphatidylglycerol:prolipoprotein diacylglycerol transferase
MRIVLSFDPIIAQLGPLQLGWHGIFTTLAVAVGVRYGLRRAKQMGLPAAPLGGVATWAVVGGLIGARLFHVLDHLPYYAAHPPEALAVYAGGIAVYGAFLGGIAGGWIAARRARLPVWRLLDAFAPAMLAGQAIGRFG